MALTVSADHRVTDVCRSEGLGANVVSASLAFNHADAYAIKLYVSAAVLCFDDRLGPPLSARDNGRILLLEPDVNGQCLSISQMERYAVQTGGVDVKVYATGIRTACAGTLHTNWEWYVTDNGPNVRRKCARVTRKCARVRRK